MPRSSLELNCTKSGKYSFLAGGHCEAQGEDAGDGQMMRWEHIIRLVVQYIDSIRVTRKDTFDMM